MTTGQILDIEVFMLYRIPPKPQTREAQMDFALHRTMVEGTDGRDEKLGPADIGKQEAA